MTDYNKGDIIEATADLRERLEVVRGEAPEVLGKGDHAVLNGETLRVVGRAREFLGLAFILAAPMDVDITDLDVEEFNESPFDAKYDGLVLLLDEEIQGSNGVLAGV